MDGGVDRRPDADRHVGPRILVQPVADGQDAAFVVERDLNLMAVVTGMRATENMLVPILDPFHRPIEAAREPGDQYVLGIDMALDAEASAHVGRDGAHARLRQCKARGDLPAHPMHHLRRRPDRDRVERGVVLRNDTAALDRHAGVAVVVETVREPARRRGKYRRRIALPHAQPRDDVARQRLMHQGSIGIERGIDARDTRQRLQIKIDQRDCILGKVAISCDDCRQRLTDMTDLVGCEGGIDSSCSTASRQAFGGRFCMP